jgi:signal transduction histidine kinase
MNLVANAVKYTPAGGRVRIGLTAEESTACLTVRDTGIGIPPEHLPQIFDRFYRVDAGRSRDSGGSGLGLAIVRWVVEAHSGIVAATSEVGRGSTFTVRLPLMGGVGGLDAVPAEEKAGANGENGSVRAPVT